MWSLDEYFSTLSIMIQKFNIQILTLLLDFSQGMCHKHILQQEIKLYKIVKDAYIIPMFIPKICYILETFDMGNILKHQTMSKF
jgi:hypothetical protein